MLYILSNVRVNYYVAALNSGKEFISSISLIMNTETLKIEIWQYLSLKKVTIDGANAYWTLHAEISGFNLFATVGVDCW